MAIPGASSRAISLCLLIAGSAAQLGAGECVRPIAAPSPNGQPISLRLADVAPRTALAAIGMWGACGAGGGGAAVFALEERGGRVLTVRRAASSGRAVCGELRGSEIVLYAFALGLAGVVRCEGEAETLAHELGHVLGLGDAPAEAACASHIMAANPGSGGPRRAVHLEECRAVDHRQRIRHPLWAALGIRVAQL